MPQITRLGHVGLFCNDLMKMRDFYSRVMGLTITDEDLERGICFLSADPEAEHHELALARAKDPPQKTHNVQQVSFKVKNLDDVRAFYHRLQNEGLRIDRTVTHGIACSVYFYDPEDNRIELYYTTPYQIRQPLGQQIDLDALRSLKRPVSEMRRGRYGMNLAAYDLTCTKVPLIPILFTCTKSTRIRTPISTRIGTPHIIRSGVRPSRTGSMVSLNALP